MLAIANTVKLVAEIAMLALLGQAVLGLLAGSKKDLNLFYQILRTVGQPFVVLARHLSPRIVLDRHVPLVAFLLLLMVWLLAPYFRSQLWLRIGVDL